METFWERAVLFLQTTGLRILFAVLLLLLSFRLIDLVFLRIGKKKKWDRYDKTMAKTVLYLARIAAKTVILAAALGYLGLDTGGLTALLASLGVGVGLAVNGALSNMAGGVLILVTRPFRVDDYISAGGYEGTVTDIRLCATRLLTVDRRTVYLPNGNLATGTVVNYSEEPLRRLDLLFHVPEGTDIGRVRDILLSVLSGDERVLSDPAPAVNAGDFGEYGLELTGKAWVRNRDFWDAKFALSEAAAFALYRDGIRLSGKKIDLYGDHSN